MDTLEVSNGPDHSMAALVVIPPPGPSTTLLKAWWKETHAGIANLKQLSVYSRKFLYGLKALCSSDCTQPLHKCGGLHGDGADGNPGGRHVYFLPGGLHGRRLLDC